MQRKYNPSKKLNPLISEIGISKHFSKHSKEIDDTVKFRREMNNEVLEELARIHTKDNQRDYEKKETIVLVHPFYFMHDKKYLNKKTTKEFDKYYKKLEFVLRNSYPNFSLVLYDSYLNYVARTGKLAEKGYFDKIIFSEQDSGITMNKLELTYFNKKKIFVGGLYNGGCIGKAITEIRENSIPRKIRAIKDLILEDISLNEKSIRSKKIYDRFSKRVRTTTVENLFEEKFEMLFGK